ALHRLDPSADHIAGDLEVDRTALRSKLVTLVEKPLGLVEIASLVEQFAKQRTRQPSEVGVATASALGDLEGVAEAVLRGRDTEQQPVRDPSPTQSVYQVVRILAALHVPGRPGLEPVDLIEVVAVGGREGRHAGGRRDDERAQAVRL